MSDTAGDYPVIKAISTEGLESLFEVMPTGADTADTLQWVSIVQAAARLNKSERTIHRYLKASKLASKTDWEGRLLVGLSARADTSSRVPTGEGKVNIDLPTSSEQSADRLTLVLTDADEFDDAVNALPTDAATLQNNFSKEMDKHLELIKQLQEQVQAASYRNGYLESKLEEREKDIKLLTDSQHKSSWWSQFSRWFFKSQ